MLETKYLYLSINIFIISIPLIRSFEPRIAFYKKLKALGLGLLITSIFFIIWDISFTYLGFLSFNSTYIYGIWFLGLPLEQYLFFITIPYAFVFNYVTINHFIKKDLLASIQKHITNYLIGFSGAMAVIYYNKWYTLTAFLFVGLFVAYLHYVAKPEWLSRFYLAYLVSFIPIHLAMAVLTGSFIENEVVWYNDLQNTGLRLGTIPLETVFYVLLLLLMNTYFYEKFSNISERKVMLTAEKIYVKYCK